MPAGDGRPGKWWQPERSAHRSPGWRWRSCPTRTRPPQGPLAHHGEPEVHSREGMGHDDVAGLVQHELTLRRKLGDCLVDLRVVYRGQVLEVLAARRVPLARERVVDGPADALDHLVDHGPATPWI